jgi:5-methylcytosine-specific restriction enzyme A
MGLLRWIKGWFRKPLPGRSSQWPSVRTAFLKKHPKCAVCGTTAHVEVHHIVPVHVSPSVELSPNNLISLCERDHFLFGHLCDWKTWNEDVVRDAYCWSEKIRTRRW